MIVNSKMIELSESNVKSGGYLTAKFVICDFNPNRNNVQLNRQAEKIEEMIKTLDGMPLVGKILVNDDGELDFGGHEVYKEKIQDENGNEFEIYRFNTEAFGVFYDTKIEEIDGVEVITSMCKIWTRFREACEVVYRLFEEGRMEVSWEISSIKKHYSLVNGVKVKVLDEFWFDGTCLLGEEVAPAYKNNAYMLDVASLNKDKNELAQALIKDIVKNNKGGQKNMSKEVSSLTTRDLYNKIIEKLNEEDSWKYCISMIYPEEKRVIYFKWSREKESDFLETTYSVEDDEVKLGESKKVEMVFIPKSEMEQSEQSQVIVQLDETAKLLSQKEIKIEEMNKEISTLKTKVTEQAEGILKLNKDVEDKDREISELTPFKEQVEKIESEKKEKEVAEKKEKLKELATARGFITKEELETSEEIKKMIDELDESGIKCLIADRVMSQLEKEDKSKENEKEVETSTVKVDITNTSNDNDFKSKSAIDIFLGK